MLSSTPQAIRPEEFLLPAVHLDLFCSAKGLRQVVFARSITFSYQFYGEDWNEEILNWLRSYAKKIPMRREFPLDAEGLSPFQKRILEKLDAVAFGHTCSYADVAGRRYARAVGNVCNKNPWPLFIGCHRILASSGKIGGFAFGEELKRSLLDFENDQRILGASGDSRPISCPA